MQGATTLATAADSGGRLLAREPKERLRLFGHGEQIVAGDLPDSLRRRLRDELGAAPSEPTKELHRLLLTAR